MTLQLKLAVRGNLQEFFAKEFRILEVSVTSGIRQHAAALQGDLRRETSRALNKGGGGGKVARAWRRRVYPTTGASVGSASVIWSKAPKIIRAFEDGTTIRARRKQYLAIPTENAPKLGSNRKKIQPSNWPESRFGKLRFVKTRRGAILVADNLRGVVSRKTGKTSFRSGSKRKKGGPVVMFILVPQVNPRKRLNIERTVERRLPTLVNAISTNYNRGAESITGLFQ
ncbi:MAG: DUF6441 family protein [Geminicoccaceae bacterium]